jgi:predicted RNA-binding Zn-ribbon protein involved in translation (DUF1610 family)
VNTVQIEFNCPACGEGVVIDKKRRWGGASYTGDWAPMGVCSGCQRTVAFPPDGDRQEETG